MSFQDDIEDEEVKYSCCESYFIHFFPAIADALTVSGALHVYVAVDTTIKINLGRFHLSEQPSVFEQQNSVCVVVVLERTVEFLFYHHSQTNFDATVGSMACGHRDDASHSVSGDLFGKYHHRCHESQTKIEELDCEEYIKQALVRRSVDCS